MKTMPKTRAMELLETEFSRARQIRDAASTMDHTHEYVMELSNLMRQLHRMKGSDAKEYIRRMVILYPAIFAR